MKRFSVLRHSHWKMAISLCVALFAAPPLAATAITTEHTATDNQGRQVLLKDDGTWEYLTAEPVRSPAPSVSLSSIVTGQKAGRNGAHLTFNLSIQVAAHSPSVTPKLSHHNLFKVTDSLGNNYLIIDVAPKLKQLQPGQAYPLAVRVQGPPTGALVSGMPLMHLEIDAAVFGSTDTLRFVRRLDAAPKPSLR